MDNKTRIVLILQTIFVFFLVGVGYFYSKQTLIIEGCVFFVFAVLPYLCINLYILWKNRKYKYHTTLSCVVHKFMSVNKIIHERFVTIQALKKSDELPYKTAFFWEGVDDVNYLPKISYVLNTGKRKSVKQEDIFLKKYEKIRHFTIPLNIRNGVSKKILKNEKINVNITYELDDILQNGNCDYIMYTSKFPTKIVLLMVDFTKIILDGYKITKLTFIESGANIKTIEKSLPTNRNIIYHIVNNPKINREYKIKWTKEKVRQ